MLTLLMVVEIVKAAEVDRQSALKDCIFMLTYIVNIALTGDQQCEHCY